MLRSGLVLQIVNMTKINCTVSTVKGLRKCRLTGNQNMCKSFTWNISATLKIGLQSRCFCVVTIECFLNVGKPTYEQTPTISHRASENLLQQVHFSADLLLGLGAEISSCRKKSLRLSGTWLGSCDDGEERMRGGRGDVSWAERRRGIALRSLWAPLSPAGRPSGAPLLITVLKRHANTRALLTWHGVAVPSVKKATLRRGEQFLSEVLEGSRGGGSHKVIWQFISSWAWPAVCEPQESKWIY